MPVAVLVKKSEYHDSMVLMQINHRVSATPGIARAALMMGTESNKPYIAHCGFHDQKIAEAQASDLVICVDAVDAEVLQQTITLIESLLKERGRRPRRGRHFASIESACDSFPDANLALISVPGQFAGREAKRALLRDLHVFLFSDNVPIEEEIALKKLAAEKGLLLMGPDCGTAVINGMGLGFANAVRQGPVGIIGSSGTGIQEVCVLLEKLAGLGISQAIGTGGRDLTDAVDARATLTALQFLRLDPETKIVVLISKPPSEQVADKVVQAAITVGKPMVICFLGKGREGSVIQRNDIYFARTLEEAALKAINLLLPSADRPPAKFFEKMRGTARAEHERLRPEQKSLRGIFSGGTFCYEAIDLLRDRLGDLHSNLLFPGVSKLRDRFSSQGNTLVDMGDDEFTRGRVHPMIDPTSVGERIISESKDPAVGVILFDLVLGFGTHPEPASVLVPAIRTAKEEAKSEGRTLAFVAHVCGTERDPQNGKKQEKTLQEVGVFVMPTNVQSIEMALSILTGR